MHPFPLALFRTWIFYNVQLERKEVTKSKKSLTLAHFELHCLAFSDTQI